MYTLMMYSLEILFTTLKISIRLLIVTVLSVFFGFAIFYFYPEALIMPKTVLLIFGAISYIIIIGWRRLYTYFFIVVKSKKKVIFTGYTSTVSDAIHELNKFSYIGFETGAIFEEDVEIIKDIDPSIPILSTREEFENFISKTHAYIFILPEEKTLSKNIRHILFNLVEKNAIFYTLPEFYELIARKIPLGAINEMWFLRNISFDGQFPYLFIKRVFDIILSVLLLLLTILFWPLVALIIKIESHGPVFFRQVREGKNGNKFSMVKFRTMRSDKNDFSPTTHGDSRITKFGNFMRKTRIDEIPQVLNILMGDMSFVGPRPERPEIAINLEKLIPYYRQRLIVKPGITGWDQVSGEYHSPSIEDTYKKLQYDLYYIKNRSIFLDISIFFKTVLTVFMKAGM